MRNLSRLFYQIHLPISIGKPSPYKIIKKTPATMKVYY